MRDALTTDIQATPDAIRALKGVPQSLKLAARAALGLRLGRFRAVLPDGRALVFDSGVEGPEAEILVHDPKFTARIVTGGVIGVAESYIDGQWDTPDLTSMLCLFAANYDAVGDELDGNVWARIANRVFHWLRPNTKTGSQKNIYSHYDIGNAFYEKWLDETMTYSAARYAHPEQSLHDAQVNKYRSLAEQIDLTERSHVLEIGAGWGGFAEYAAKERGARVTGITISKEQYEFARQRMFEQQLAEKVEIKLQDYRDVSGAYDRIASIEMFEAVGEAYWPSFFEKIRDSLRPGGMAGLQIITIRDDLFEHYRNTVDFIQRYVFPGGMLPSPARLSAEIKAAGLEERGALSFGADYDRTLGEWADAFRARWRDIAPLGFDERFKRLWEFYLAYCQAGFRTRRIDVGQFAIARP